MGVPGVRDDESTTTRSTLRSIAQCSVDLVSLDTSGGLQFTKRSSTPFTANTSTFNQMMGRHRKVADDELTSNSTSGRLAILRGCLARSSFLNSSSVWDNTPDFNLLHDVIPAYKVNKRNVPQLRYVTIVKEGSNFYLRYGEKPKQKHRLYAGCGVEEAATETKKGISLLSSEIRHTPLKQDPWRTDTSTAQD